MILLNPGPVNVSPRVTEALGRGDICHREPECAQLLARVRARLVQAFAPAGGFRAALITGSGTSAVEMAVRSSVSEGGKLVVVVNGVYGERMVAMAEAAGIEVVMVRSAWTERPDLGAVAEALRTPGAEALAAVHNETTTGLLNPIAELGALAHHAGALFVVDSVSGLAGDTLDLEAACVDMVAGTSGKCIQAFPGMGFVLVRDGAADRVAANPARSVYLSLRTYLDHAMPFTPAVQVAYALDEALGELLEETVAGRIDRYAAAAARLRAGFDRLGLECLLPRALRTNTITSLRMPEGHDYGSLHDGLRERGFVIYEGQGKLASEIVRVCNMGHLTTDDFDAFLTALGEVLER